MARPPASFVLDLPLDDRCELRRRILADFPRLDDFISSPKDKADAVFRWYVGHDPYNSAENEAFMRRLIVERTHRDMAAFGTAVLYEPGQIGHMPKVLKVLADG